jgi:trehalose-phosphatase
MTVVSARSTRQPLDEFFANVAQAARRVLLLDYDGTLAPFHVDPRHAHFYPGVREHIDAIMEDARTTLVLVSGRWTRDLLPMLTLRRLPEIWGAHGWEQLKPDGEYVTAAIDEPALRQLLIVDEQCEAIHAHGGRCEHKPGSLAVHWRGDSDDEIAEIRVLLERLWAERSLAQTLTWNDFDGGVEFRVRGHDKGKVIDTVLAREGPCPAAFLGDDLTDEDGFVAIKGRGLGVLVRPEYRPTQAELWLRPPDQLLEFLQRWRDIAQGS